jgi:hypothetical protein
MQPNLLTPRPASGTQNNHSTNAAIQLKLTDVELSFARAFDPRLDVTAEDNRRWIKDRLREVAFHEAGHVVGRMFTNLAGANIVQVSVIPDQTTLGRVSMTMNFEERFFPIYPQPTKRCIGISLLLWLLAGRGAELRVRGCDADELLDEDHMWEEQLEDGTDISRVVAIAAAMERKRNPADRILEKAAKLTNEMLDLPEVWNAIDRLANVLIDRAVLEDMEEVEGICGCAVGLSLKIPRWRRRLNMTAKERRELSGQQIAV